MITRQTRDGLLCVHQLDHSRLAGRFAEWWGGGAVPGLKPRSSVLRAVSEHDGGWSDFDARPVWDPRTGRPHTYLTQPVAERIAVADRSIANLADVDPYAGWLIGRHFASFYEESTDPELRAWMQSWSVEQARLYGEAEEAWRGRDVLEGRVMEANFDWLQLFDALSLAVVHDWPRWQSRPTARDYDGAIGTFHYDRHEPSSVRLVVGHVRPYPFTPIRLTEHLPARIIQGHHWISQEALSAAWVAGNLVMVEVALTAG